MFYKVGKSNIVVLSLKCVSCNRIHSVNKMSIFEIKRNWQEFVYQKDIINAQDINLCCGTSLEFFIGNKIAREVLYTK